jgi:hypothetical protein
MKVLNPYVRITDSFIFYNTIIGVIIYEGGHMRIKKRILYIGSIILIAVAALLLGLYLRAQSAWEINPTDFYEKPFGKLDLDDEERNNIRKYLQDKYIVGTDRAGFSAFAAEISLVKAYGIYCLADNIDHQGLKEELFVQLNGLSRVNVEELDMLNLYYYLYLCQEYAIATEYERFEPILAAHYDSTEQLFNLFGANDLLANKIWISGHLATLLSVPTFPIMAGLLNTYDNYLFKSPSANDTFFNSGGDIIYALVQNDMIDPETLFSEHGSWLELWIEEYSGFSVLDATAAMIYADFLNIINAFGVPQEEYINKLKDYYTELTVEEITSGYDPIILSPMFKYLNDPEANSMVYETILQLISEAIENLLVTSNSIDAAETSFGIHLASEVDFPINKDLINKTLESYFQSNIFANQNIHAKAFYLYHYIYSYEINNELIPYVSPIPFSAKVLQDIIDEILAALTYNKESILQDLQTARYVVDVVANLQIFGMNLKIRVKYVEDIIAAMKQFAVMDKQNSVFMVNLYRMDYILKSSIFKNSDYERLIQRLKNSDDGFKNSDRPDLPADIYSTFAVLSAGYYFDDYQVAADTKNFVAGLKLDAGIYGSAVGGESTMRSILYGNIIKSFNLNSGEK